MRRRPEREAEELLRQLGVSAPPVDVERIATDLGIKVVYDHLEDDISALIYRRGDSSVILVSEDQADARQRFSIAHEIGHFQLHNDPVFVERPAPHVDFRNSRSTLGSDRKEIDANAFAAALLMPAEWILESVGREQSRRRPPNEDRLVNTLSREYHVSKEAARFRLVNLGVIGTF